MTKSVCCAIKPLPNDKHSSDLSPTQYLNSEDIIGLKKQLHGGQLPSACESCHIEEKNGIPSLRQKINGILTQGDPKGKNWIDVYLKNKNNFESDMILMADVKIGNTCNHACLMCHPHSSSLIYRDWAGRKDSEFVKEYLEKDKAYFEKAKFNGYKNTKYAQYLADVLEKNKHIKYLKLIGGEPFLDTRLLQTLADMNQKQKDYLELSFVTNGSIDIVETLKKIGSFKNIQISISLEGIGEIQEFARAGSTWLQLEENILRTIDAGCCDVTIHHTLQTATVMGFKQLLDWCKKYNITLSCGTVTHPDYLSIRSLPTVLKNKIIKDINGFDSLFVVKDNVEEENLTYEKLINKIEGMNFDQTLHDKFLRYIGWYQENKNIPRFENLFPEFFEL